MKRLLVVSTGLAVMLGAAAGWARSWTPVIDTYGSSRAQYVDRDLRECQGLAQQAGGDAVGQGARGLLRGGLLGGAGGAAIGAAFGSAGRGAAVGAAAGGLTSAVGGASRSNAGFEQAFRNCMRQRGHTVLN